MVRPLGSADEKPVRGKHVLYARIMRGVQHNNHNCVLSTEKTSRSCLLLTFRKQNHFNSEAVTSVSGSREHLYARVHFLAQLRVVFPFVEGINFQFLYGRRC